MIPRCRRAAVGIFLRCRLRGLYGGNSFASIARSYRPPAMGTLHAAFPNGELQGRADGGPGPAGGVLYYDPLPLKRNQLSR